MASKNAKESTFNSDKPLACQLPEAQQINGSTKLNDHEGNAKKKFKFHYFDLVAITSLLIAALALILIFIQLSNGLNQSQSYSNSNEKVTIQPDFQILQAQVSSLLSIQTQMNSSLKRIQSLVNEGITRLLAKTQLQHDILKQDYGLLIDYRNYSTQQLNFLQTQKNKLSHKLVTLKEEFQVAKNFSNSFTIGLLNLHEDALANAAKLNKLQREVQVINDTLEEVFYLSIDIGTLTRPASSCKDISQEKPSRDYWIQTQNTSSPVQVYCDTNSKRCSCNTAGGWMRVANLDMTDPTQQCPDGFSEVRGTEPPLRICGRPDGLIGCVNTSFPVHGIEYSRVCGRIIGYQVGPPAAFHAYNNQGQDIDGFYIDGISITHGQSPRQHIWSFVGAVSEQYTFDYSHICPCTRSSVGDTYVPPFLGEDYFCDTALRDNDWTFGEFYPGDPLWDGQGCGSGSTCCEFNNPPWFCKQLPEPTTDDIEMRLCDQQARSNSETPFEVVELYIK